ncbi:hypothetical protein YC2023_083666 [Brassica napus]
MRSLKLFSYHSLRKEKQPMSILKLSEKMVQITGLLPRGNELMGVANSTSEAGKDPTRQS